MTDTPKQYRLRQNIKAKLHREGNVYEIIGQKGRFIQKEVFERDYEPVRGDGWRPIAEAVRDSTKLILSDPSINNGSPFIGQWIPFKNGGRWAESIHYDAVYPTHFMPLPPPPKTEEQQG